jgi:hypothetical protein
VVGEGPGGGGVGGVDGGAHDVTGAFTHRPSPTKAAPATLHARLVYQHDVYPAPPPAPAPPILSSHSPTIVQPLSSHCPIRASTTSLLQGRDSTPRSRTAARWRMSEVGSEVGCGASDPGRRSWASRCPKDDK